MNLGAFIRSVKSRSAGALDAFARPEITLLGRRICSFHACGMTGLVLGATLGMTLAVQQGLSPRVLGILVFASSLTFVVVALSKKVITGEESLVYYHHEIAILAVSAAVLRWLGQPVLPFLDIVVLGVGLFLACGRVGCLMVGCCHGRPCSWGVAYRPEHARTGFADHLVGVRLFPMQAVESIFVFGVVAAGSVLVLRGRPGEALVIYIFAYGAARFVFELARGDEDRPYLAGFSEAQWTSLVLMILGLGVGLRGGLPLVSLQATATTLVVLILGVVVIRRRLDPVPRFALLHPQHVSEVAAALRQMPSSEPAPQIEVQLVETSRGLRLSRGRLGEDPTTGDVAGEHYCLSCAGPPMGRATAALIADLIRRLRPSAGRATPRLVASTAGVFHLLIPVRPPSGGNDPE